MKFLACCVLPDKKIYGNCLYWLNILHLNFFHLALENRVCREIFHCIEYIFYHSRFLSNLRLPLNTEFALKIFAVLNTLLHSGFLSNLPLPWKTKCALNSLCWIYFFNHSGFLSNLRLPWKTELPWNFLSLRIFEQLALALKTEFSWIHCIECIFFIIQDFWATFTCPEKHDLPWYFSLYWNIFIIQDFWACCACTENRVCPENFQDRGTAAPPPPTSYAYDCDEVEMQLTAWSFSVDWGHLGFWLQEFDVCIILKETFRCFEFYQQMCQNKCLFCGRYSPRIVQANLLPVTGSLSN